MTSHRRFFLSTVQFQHRLDDGSMSMSDIIDTAHELGADGLELRRDHWPQWKSELDDARHQLEEHRLAATFATFSTLFNDETEGEAWLSRDIDIAVQLGCIQLRVFQGPAPDETDDVAWDVARHATDKAAALGLRVAVENAGGPPGNSLAEIERVLGEFPALSTNLDIGNYAMLGQDVVAAIRALGPHISSTHLKDLPPPPDEVPVFLGGGILPLDAIFNEFARLPQPLIHCFEFTGGENPEERIKASFDFLLARQGRV